MSTGMKMTRRVGMALATTSLGAVTLAAASPAEAAPVPIGSAPCAVQLCFYNGQGFTAGGVAYNVATNSCINLPSAANNQTTSIVNKSYRDYYVYDGAGCTSYMARIFARTANDNIGPANNDRISSFRRVP